MKTSIEWHDLTVNPLDGGLQVSARLQHKNDKGTEELVVSIRLPAGDWTLLELQQLLIDRARTLLKAASETSLSDPESAPGVWAELAK